MLIYAADEATPTEHEIPLAGKRIRVATLDISDEPEVILRRVSELANDVRLTQRVAIRELTSLSAA
jgi:hypothetical protein